MFDLLRSLHHDDAFQLTFLKSDGTGGSVSVLRTSCSMMKREVLARGSPSGSPDTNAALLMHAAWKRPPCI